MRFYFLKNNQQKHQNEKQLTSKKQNEALFFRILDTIRPWELISPDVMSAVEFCRERILDIPLSEFELWFKTKHPECFINQVKKT